MDKQVRQVSVSVFITMLILLLGTRLAENNSLFGAVSESTKMENYFYIVNICFWSIVFIKVVISSEDFQLTQWNITWKRCKLHFYYCKNYLTVVTLVQLSLVLYSIVFELDYSLYKYYIKSSMINILIITIWYTAGKLKTRKL